MGGDYSSFDYPEIINDASELYVRLPLYIDVYKYLFLNPDYINKENKLKTLENQAYTINLLPEMKGTPFAGIFQLMWRRFDSSQTLTDMDIKNLIVECNHLYHHFKPHNSVHDIINNLVECVNARYGRIKNTELKFFKDYVKEEEEYDNKNSQSIDIFDDYSVVTPLVSALGANKPDDYIYKLEGSKIIVDEFMSKLHGLFDQYSQTYNNGTRQPIDSFKDHIKNMKDNLKHIQGNTDKFNLIRDGIKSVNYKSQNILNLIKSELLDTPLNLLEKLYQDLKTKIISDRFNLYQWISTGLFTYTIDSNNIYIEWPKFKSFIENYLEYLKRICNILRQHIDINNEELRLSTLQSELLEGFINNKVQYKGLNSSLKDYRGIISMNSGNYNLNFNAETDTDPLSNFRGELIHKIICSNPKNILLSKELDTTVTSKNIFTLGYNRPNMHSVINNLIYEYINYCFDHNNNKIYSKILYSLNEQTILHNHLTKLIQFLVSEGTEKIKIYSLLNYNDLDQMYKEKLSKYLPIYQQQFKALLNILNFYREFRPKTPEIDTYIILIENILHTINEILKEVDIVTLWGDLSPNFIENYYKDNNKYPITPLYCIQYLPDLSYVKYNSDYYRLSFIIGVDNEISKYPGLQEIVKQYNGNYSEKIDRNVLQLGINILHQFKESMYRYHFMSHKYRNTGTSILNIYTPKPSNEVIRIIRSLTPKYNLIVSGSFESSMVERKKAILNNIIDLNINPINIFALYRQIPLIGLYVYSFNTDLLIKEWYKNLLATKPTFNTSNMEFSDPSTTTISYNITPLDYQVLNLNFTLKHVDNLSQQTLVNAFRKLSPDYSKSLDSVLSLTDDEKSYSYQNILLLDILNNLSKDILSKLDQWSPSNQKILRSTGILLQN